MSGHLKYDVATGHLLYGDDGHLVWKCYFEADAGLTAPAAQLSATATFLARTYSGDAALDVAPASLDADATFTIRTYAATADLIAPNAELAASADHDHPSYDATAVLTTGAATLSSEAFFALSDCVIDLTTSGFTLHNPLVFTAPEIGYAFYLDHVSSRRGLYYRKTTDGGHSWSLPVTVFQDVNQSALAIATWYEKWTPGDTGTKIHIWWHAGGSGNDTIRYRSLDTATDTLGTTRTALTASTTGAGHWISGAKMLGGNLYVAFNALSFTGLCRSTDGGVNWTTRTNPHETLDDHALVLPGNETDDNDAWLLYHDADADELTQKIHRDATNLNGESAVICTHVAETNANGEDFDNFFGAIRHSDHALIVASVSQGDFRLFEVRTAITELTAIATDTDNVFYPKLHIDNADRIYVTYIGKSDGSELVGTNATPGASARVYYAVSTDDGDTWDQDNIVSADFGLWRREWTPPTGPAFLVAFMPDTGHGSEPLWIDCERGIFTHTATATLTAPAATLTATGVRGLTYTATAALTSGAARMVAIANTTGEEVSTGVADLDVGAATLTASAQHESAANDGTAVLTTVAAELSAIAFFVEPEEGTAFAILVAKGATLSALGTHTEKTYSANVSLSAGAATLSANADFVEEGTNAVANLVAGGATLSASGTHTEKTYSANASLTTGKATLSASASHQEEEDSTGAASLTTGKATLSASGTFTEKTYTANASLNVRRATMSASASHDPRQYTATASLSAGAASMSGSGSHTEPSGFDCANCESGTTPESVVVRICGPANGSCSDCAEIEGDYVLDQDQTEPYCTYFHSSSTSCGTLHIQLTFTPTSITGGIDFNGAAPTAIGISLTAPYDCEAERTLSVTPNPFGDCIFSSSTIVLNPAGCQHCTEGTTPETLTLILNDAPVNNGCDQCTFVGNSWTLTRDCANPCFYTYFGSTACGDIEVSATISNTGISGTVVLDNTTAVQFSASLTAPFNCTTSRSVSVIGSSGPTCDFSHITSGTIFG